MVKAAYPCRTVQTLCTTKLSRSRSAKKRLQVVIPRNGRKYRVEFIVVKKKGKLLLGLRASEEMQVISVVRQNNMFEEPSQSKTPLTAETILKEHADVFRGEGKLKGDLHLEIDPNVPPVQLPTRKVPIINKEKLKVELDRLEGLSKCSNLLDISNRHHFEEKC